MNYTLFYFIYLIIYTLYNKQFAQKTFQKAFTYYF